MERFRGVRVLHGWFVACVACGGSAAPVGGGGEGTAQPPAEEVRLESGGSLSEGDVMHGEAYVDEYVIPVEAGERLMVDLSSESFDPVVRVTPPGGTTLTDDDFEGSRERSHLEMAIAQSGSLKVEVTSHQPGATGAYRLRVTRPAQRAEEALDGDLLLAVGEPRRGTLDDADDQLPDGRPVESYTLQQPAGRPTTLRLSGSAEAVVMDPAGHQLSLGTGGSLVLSRQGVYRVQVIGRAGQPSDYQLVVTADGASGAGGSWPVLGRPHHRFPEDGQPREEVRIGSETRGVLSAEATTLPSGETARLYRVPVQPGHELSLDLSSEAFDTYLMVAAPGGEHWENDDAGGGRNSSLTVPVQSRGALWVVVTSYERGEEGEFTLKISETARAAVSGGSAPAAASLQGELASGDGVLESGALVDRYTATLQAGQRVELGVMSSAFDTVLTVTGPGGVQQSNDDIDYQGGNTNSALTFTVQQSGVHRIAVASYQRGESGAYTLTASGAELRPAGAAPSAPVAPSEGGPNVRTVSGELASGDQTLGSGEFVDSVELELPAHAAVNLQLTSSAFDTYLAVVSPDGQRNENDDVSPNDTSSALQLRTQAAGRYRVFVTSYRPGETGPYELVAQWSGGGANVSQGGGAGSPPEQPGSLRGSLAQGDSQLQSGEFFDEHSVTLEPGQPAQIGATSAAFDTYLIVQTPSGRQLDNDDVAPNDTNSRVEIPSAEAGEYRVLITSYRAGETGAYELSIGASSGGPVVAAGGGGGAAAGGSGGSGAGGRIFGIFAGISDYPGNGNDLPECANDAIKLAETLREAGLMTADRQVVLTDQRATRGAVEAAFRRMTQQMGPSDTFVFFYSGHGGQRMGSTDARELDRIDETLVLYDGEVIDDDVAAWFEPVQSLAIVALDACFAGGFAKDVISVPGRMGLFSSQEDVLSAVAAQFQAGGYLSHFLRMAFRGDADQGPRDGVLTAGELSHFVLNQFGSHVRDVQMQDAWQHPVIERGGVRAGLPLLSYR